jgi:hypothetical protein
MGIEMENKNIEQISDDLDNVVTSQETDTIARKFSLNKETFKKLQMINSSKNFIDTRNVSSSITNTLEMIIIEYYENWKKQL